MKFEDLKSFEDVKKHLTNKKRTSNLLIGNGFSIAYKPAIFSYNALSKFIEDSDNEQLKELFTKIGTKNFEEIMQQLENFCEVAPIFSNDNDLVQAIRTTIDSLKKSLLDAVSKLHPQHTYIVTEEESQNCQNFLSFFINNKGGIFSTNYDLLMYWTILRFKKIPSDGFGREQEDLDYFVPPNEAVYGELFWGKNKTDQRIYYLHGSLFIFDNGIEIEKEVYDSEHYILEKIKTRIDSKNYPVFVSAGNKDEKLKQIMHNKYLTFCYEALTKTTGSLIVFGFGFGENDTHIIEAINKAAHYGKNTPDKLWSIYIGVFNQDNLNYYESIKSKFKIKVNYYNALSLDLWRPNPQTVSAYKEAT